MSNEDNQAKLIDHTQRQGGKSPQFCRMEVLTSFTGKDQEVVAKLAELDMMVADLEHANSRVATVERRNVSAASLVTCLSDMKGIAIWSRNCCVLKLKP